MSESKNNHLLEIHRSISVLIKRPLLKLLILRGRKYTLNSYIAILYVREVLEQLINNHRTRKIDKDPWKHISPFSFLQAKIKKKPQSAIKVTICHVKLKKKKI